MYVSKRIAKTASTNLSKITLSEKRDWIISSLDAISHSFPGFKPVINESGKKDRKRKTVAIIKTNKVRTNRENPIYSCSFFLFP